MVLGPDMEPDLVVLSNDSSSSGSEQEHENEEHDNENNKTKPEENSLTPPLVQLKLDEEHLESGESGQDSGDETDSSGTTSSSKSSQSSGMYRAITYSTLIFCASFYHTFLWSEIVCQVCFVIILYIFWRNIFNNYGHIFLHNL